MIYHIYISSLPNSSGFDGSRTACFSQKFFYPRQRAWKFTRAAATQAGWALTLMISPNQISGLTVDQPAWGRGVGFRSSRVHFYRFIVGLKRQVLGRYRVSSSKSRYKLGSEALKKPRMTELPSLFQESDTPRIGPACGGCSAMQLGNC